MNAEHHPRPGRRGSGVVLGTLVALGAAVAAPAAAEARPPRITQPPTIAGTAQVGSILQAQGAQWNGKPEPVATWQWLRCDGPGAAPGSCSEIAGATRTAYALTAADLGKRIRVLLVVRNEDGWAWARSEPTAAVTAAPAPEPSPSPEPEPSTSPSPQPSPSPQEGAAPIEPAPAFEVREEQAVAGPRLMSPAPIVRLRGRLTRRGARITLLTVRAPRGARITLRCFGRGCPARRWARTSVVTRIARFQRVLPGGTRLVITVTKPGRIGKHTTIVIRRGAVPTRRDRCLQPGGRTPVRCPAT